MKAFIKTALTAVLIYFGVLSASAQEKDYYKFDDNGFLCEFQITLPDTTVIRYKHLYDPKGDDIKPFVKGDYANIVYSDGTVVDFSKSAFNGSYYPDKYPGLKTNVAHPDHNSYYILDLNNWYKRIRKSTSAPKGPDIINNIFDLSEYTIIFPDNSQVCINRGPTEDMKITNYTDCNANGDIVEWGYDVVETIKWQGEDLPFLDTETNEIIKTGCIVSGTKVNFEHKKGINDDYFYYCTQKGKIITSSRETFTGTFDVITQYAKRGSPLMSKYLKAALAEYPNQLHGFGDIIAFAYKDGNVVNKENKIVAMYRKSKKLDEFDMESALAAEQGKIDKAQAAAKAAAKAKDALTTKYGKKYADAFLAGKVIVGMPWELVQLGIDAHSFKDFYTALISIDRSSGSGKTECYSLYGDDFTHRGHIWVSNKVVESITLY